MDELKQAGEFLLKRTRGAVETAQRIAIVLCQVDPDALGAAVALITALEAIVGRREIFTIIYGGGVAHPQNRAMRQGCPTLMTRMQSVREWSREVAVQQFSEIWLLDSSALDDTRLPDWLRPLEQAGLPLTVVIDHHHGDCITDQTEEELRLVDTQAGATCTLVAGICQAMAWPLTPEAGAALCLGISTDTKSLVAADQRDVTAYGWALERADQNRLQGWLHFPVPLSYFRHWSRSLTAVALRDGILTSTVGIVEESEADNISIIADHYLALDNAHTVLVWCVVRPQGSLPYIRLSARSVNPTIDLNGWLREKFGNGGAKTPADGRSEGGAMIKLDLGFLGEPLRPVKLIELASEVVHCRIYGEPLACLSLT